MVKKNSKKLKELRHLTRNQNIKEGIFTSARTSFGDYYISPFAIAVNASNSIVTLLSSITGLLGPLSQMFGSRLMNKYTRKQILLYTIFFEALMWIPFIITAILFAKGILHNAISIFLLFFFTIYVILNGLSYPAWFSLIGDIVNENKRGRWFSKRNLIIGFSSVILAIIAALILDYFKQHNQTMIGFVILFSLAGISRLLSWHSFKNCYEPKLKIKKKYCLSFKEFILNANNTNFGKFAIFKSILSFATYISSPLIAIYLLRVLEFNYITFMIVSLSGTIYSLFVIELWGKIADRYGNYRVLCLSSILIPIVPILWILVQSPIYMLLVPTLIGGIGWAGFNLASGNFIYDNVSSPKRGLVIPYYNMLNGIGVSLGAALGAILIKILTIEYIFVIFVIGGIARMIAVFIFIPKLKEIRKTKKLKSPNQLKKLILKETKPTILEEIHEIASIKKYFVTK